MGTFVFTLFLGLAGLSGTASAGIDPPGDCCTDSGGLGCEVLACQQAVCEIDSSCCDTGWDSDCADLADTTCPALCGGGLDSDCCTDGGNGGQGCDDGTCEAAVCNADPTCCNDEWDTLCSVLAQRFQCRTLCTQLDDYLCYKVKQSKESEKFEKRTDSVDDCLEEEKDFESKKPVALCNPVDVQGVDDILYPEDHYVAYQIKEAKGEEKHEKIQAISLKPPSLFNLQINFEWLIDTNKVDRILVPSGKDIGQMPDPYIPSIDHLKCYKIKNNKETPDVPKKSPITLRDQFEGEQSRLFEATLDKPTRLCLPADKNDEGILNPQWGIMCFKVKPDEKHTKLDDVYTTNQFHDSKWETSKEEEFCTVVRKPELGNPE